MGNRIALVIGAGTFSSGLNPLRTPKLDVAALGAALSDPNVGGFDEVITLTDQTEATLRRAVAKLFAKRKRDDLLLLYYSGHGLLDAQGQLHLAAQDTEADYLSSTALSAAYVAAEMDGSRSRRQILILDCCHSGAFGQGAKNVENPHAAAQAFKGNGYGRVILTASDATQFAWESDGELKTEHSVFTHFLLEGLRGKADLDSDGQISLDELYGYVYEQILDKAPRQTPGKSAFGQQGDLLVAMRRRALNPTIRQWDLTQPATTVPVARTIVPPPQPLPAARQPALIAPRPFVPVKTSKWAILGIAATIWCAVFVGVGTAIWQIVSRLSTSNSLAAVVPSAKAGSQVRSVSDAVENDALLRGLGAITAELTAAGCTSGLFEPSIASGDVNVSLSALNLRSCVHAVAFSGSVSSSPTLEVRVGEKVQTGTRNGSRSDLLYCPERNGAGQFVAKADRSGSFGLAVLTCPRQEPPGNQDPTVSGSLRVRAELSKLRAQGCDNVLLTTETTTGNKTMTAKLSRGSRCIYVIAATGVPDANLIMTMNDPFGEAVKTPAPSSFVKLHYCATSSGEHVIGLAASIPAYFTVAAVDCPRR